MHLERVTIPVTTTGSAGAATGTGLQTGPLLYGFLWDVYINYHGSAPVTTVVVISEIGGLTIATLAASNIDKLHPLRFPATDSVGADIPDHFAPWLLAGARLQVAVSASDALTDAVIATFHIAG